MPAARTLGSCALVAAVLLGSACEKAKVEDSWRSGSLNPDPDPNPNPGPPDNEPPVVTTFTATGTSSPVQIAAFTGTDNVAVTGWAITTSATAPTSGASVWQSRAPRLFGAAAGSVTLYPWVKDAAGNVSAAYGSPVTLTLTAPTNQPSLGTNLNWCLDWDPEKLPADLVWSARPFALGNGNGATDGDPWAPIDAQGWPIVSVGTSFGAVFEGNPWPGTYKLSFKNRQGTTGDAVSSYSGNIVVENRAHNALTNVTTYDVRVPSFASQFIWLRWAGSTGGVTDVHLMRPLKDGSGWHVIGTPLSDHIVDRLKWFKAIRTMQTQGGDLMTTGVDRTWSDRTSPFGPQTRSRGSPGHLGGVAIENLVAMANQVDKDLWINVPFYVDDDYIRKMAQTLKCGSNGDQPWVTAGTNDCAAGNPTFAPLKPALAVYVEHANEMWNSGYGYWEGKNESAADADVKAGDPYYLDAVVGTQGENDSGIPGLGWRRTGYLAVRHSLIFRAVFGDAEMMARVRPVLATQTGRYGTTLHPLRYIESVWGPSSPYDKVGGYTNPKLAVKDYLYALATAPYVPDSNRSSGDCGGLDVSSPATMISSTVTMMNSSTAGCVLRAIADNASRARSYGIRYVAYEGGDNFIPSIMSGGATTTNVNNAILASFDPTKGALMGARIDAASGLPLPDQSGTVYGTLFSEWALRGGDLFMHFTMGEAANSGSMFGLCAPTSKSDLVTVSGWSASMGTSSSDCRFEFGPKWDAIKAFSRAWGSDGN